MSRPTYKQIESAYADVICGHSEPDLIICKSWGHFIYCAWMCGFAVNPLIIAPQGPGFSVR